MCLAVPMQLMEVDGQRGVVLSGGVRLAVGLDLVEAPVVEDWVLVHAGYAIAVLDEAEARETLDAIQGVLDAIEGEGG